MKQSTELQIRSRTSFYLKYNPKIRQIFYYRYIYLMLLPLALYYIIFSYGPMYGATLAFKTFDYSKGIIGSPWIGFKNFTDLIFDFNFRSAFVNTLLISFGRIIFEFPVPIILALLINEVRSVRYKRFVQTVFTFPHFISWVIVTGIVFNLLSDQGVLNQILTVMGAQKANLLTEPSTFRALLYISDNWKEAGWGTIIYLATISSINIELYEAARVDGAMRFQMIRYITWPALRSVMGLMLILSIANCMNAGFDQIFNMYNAAVYNVSDIIDTFIYRRTFIDFMDFGSSTAVGLFKSVINLILLFTANFTVKRINGTGLY